MHLISVDLPAPLSPTSAITSPSRTPNSTSRSASTDPKCFDTPCSSRVGGEVSLTRGFLSRWGASEKAPHRERLLLAVLRVDAVADLALLQEALREEELPVGLRDPDRGQQDRLGPADLSVHAGYLLSLDERDRGSGRCVRFRADGLVDSAALPAGEDELDAGRRRVLAGQADRLLAVRLQRRDHGSREPVVRSEGAVDLVAVTREDLVEDLAALDRVPLRPLIARRRLLERALRVERVQDRVVALLEQLRVVVLDVAVQLRDDGMLRVLAALLQRLDEARTLQLADLHVVEGDVVRRLASDHEPVVVDHLRTAVDGEVRDRCARRGIELVEQDHLR